MNTARKPKAARSGWTLPAAALLAIALLAACSGASKNEEELSKTIDAPDGSVSISVPDDWSEDSSTSLQGYLVLAVSDGEGAFAQVFFYPDDGSGYTAKDYSDLTSESYYGENVIGGTQETELDGQTAYYFEYSMVDEGTDGNEYNYHGYEYFIGFGADVLEVDIFYSQGKLEGKVFSPSDAELAKLRSIAETAKINQ